MIQVHGCWGCKELNDISNDERQCLYELPVRILGDAPAISVGGCVQLSIARCNGRLTSFALSGQMYLDSTSQKLYLEPCHISLAYMRTDNYNVGSLPMLLLYHELPRSQLSNL